MAICNFNKIIWKVTILFSNTVDGRRRCYKKPIITLFGLITLDNCNFCPFKSNKS